MKALSNVAVEHGSSYCTMKKQSDKIVFKESEDTTENARV